jgi:low affinity Fe/Cu permease
MTPSLERRSKRRRAIAKRTSQLPLVSKVLYRIDHVTSMPIVAVGAIGTIAAAVLAGAAVGFPRWWIAGFEISTSALTLLMVFTIQHTQGREQAATQRKLDELLHATPDAEESLMLLEEAPRATILEVEEAHRETREDHVDHVDAVMTAP